MGEHPCCPLPRMEGLGGSHLMWMGVGVLLPPSPPFPLSLTPFLVQAKGRQKRVKAVVDCKGDKARELTFSKGEVIVVTREEDEQSWVSTACHGPPPSLLSLHSLPSGARCWVMPHLWGSPG